jgi:hypothetical protein
MASPKFVVWVRDYYDDRNRKLRERVIVSGERPPQFARFVVEGSVTVRFEDEEGLKEAVRKFARQIYAESVEEAYALYESELARGAEEATTETLAQIQKAARRLILPGPGHTPPARGPNGPQKPRRKR